MLYVNTSNRRENNMTSGMVFWGVTALSAVTAAAVAAICVIRYHRPV